MGGIVFSYQNLEFGKWNYTEACFTLKGQCYQLSRLPLYSSPYQGRLGITIPDSSFLISDSIPNSTFHFPNSKF